MFQPTDTITRILKQHPAAARVFERHRMDYCCGGGATLEAACAERGEDVTGLLRELDELLAPAAGDEGLDLSKLSLPELADHVMATHHAYLREELPRLDAMTDRVARVHGARDPRLLAIRDTWRAVSETMSAHLEKEERILFPLIRSLAGGEGAPGDFHCGSVANPVMQMEREHDEMEDSIARLREWTDGYVAPPWACGTYRAMLEGLAAFEADTLVHASTEERLLFARAVEAEQASVS